MGTCSPTPIQLQFRDRAVAASLKHFVFSSLTLGSSKFCDRAVAASLKLNVPETLALQDP